jgi:hypothetical protein
MRILDIQKVTPEYKGSRAPMHGGRNEEFAKRYEKGQEKLKVGNKNASL